MPLPTTMEHLSEKDISLVSRGVDANQNPVDCNISIGQSYNDRAIPCPEPMAVRPDCAFEVVARPGDGWIHRPDGVVVFGGRFPDGRVHLDLGGLNLNIGIGGHGPRHFEETLPTLFATTSYLQTEIIYQWRPRRIRPTPIDVSFYPP